MKLGVRICLYVILAVIAAIFFGRFKRAYSEGVDRGRAAAQLASAVDAAPTDAASVPTNSPTADQITTTNTAVSPPSTPAAAGDDGSITNAGTNPGTGAPAQRPAAPRKAAAVIFFGVFLLALLCLGGLVAWEISRHFGNRAGRSVMAEDWVERRDPEYDKGEEEWAKGNHLEAISLMREYLKKNPDEQHVALRIAEIYEKDLNNPVAAVLEIEEVLTRKLGREKWGWTAVRLSNLYSGRLNQPDKALALLQRIVNEYSETGAAKKARQRLGIPEPEETGIAPEPETDAPPSEASSAEPAPLTPPPEDNSGPGLPKGFRPKK
ncbi:MAG TPA: hypothetical protein PLX89_09985 [Verrucomicrobiota bacterium]|nr:hypothetical protein [Verrucomicrobiales bacterium]HRI13325.1 hypothetical protein [Verrucomicrobiota bacterium]